MKNSKTGVDSERHYLPSGDWVTNYGSIFAKYHLCEKSKRELADDARRFEEREKASQEEACKRYEEERAEFEKNGMSLGTHLAVAARVA